MKKVFLVPLLFLLSFFVSTAANYYWVHTTNNWTDISNWRTTSGGSTSHISVPGPTDDVFFDANSFPSASPTVNVNSAGFCRNITFSGGWANNPSVTMSASLDIFGSLSLHSSINGATALNGDLRFEGTTTGLTINTAGKIIGIVNFNGIGGEWTLTGPTEVNMINHVNGSFITNNHNLKLNNDFRSNGSNVRSINLGTSVLDLYGWYAWGVNSNNLTLIANQSTINIHSTVIADFTCGASQAYNNINYLSASWGSSALNSGNGTTFNNVSFADNCNISGSALQFNQVTCAKDGNFGLSSSSTIQTLLLTSGKRYTFQNAQTLNVTNLTANGSCNGYIELRSANPLVQATINNTSNNSVSRAIIEAINITPNPSNNATNCIDAGNNAGWTFTAPTFNTCYWVGGTGNWSDAANHWANSSGGTPGTACVPTFMDDVVFDANSFSAAGQATTIDMQAYCNNMTWNVSAAQSPNFTGNTNFPLNIYGSLTLDADINNFNMASPVFFRSANLGQTITSAGKTFNNAVTLVGAGGWILQDNFTTNSYLRLNQGTLTTNNNNVTVNFFESITGNNRTLNLGSSLVTLNNWWWNVSGNNFNLNAGTSTIRFTNNNSSLTHSALPGNDYYNVEFNGTNQTGSGTLNNSSLGGSFNNVTFLGGGSLGNSTTINNLTFTAAKNYVLSSSATYTITGLFNAIGNCSGYIDLSSSSPGTQTTIHMPGGSTTIDYCVLKDQRVTGPGIYTANNSISQGNNTGWLIPPSAPRDLFWVGGSGNWSDQNHWATTPNGIGGACIPTLSDDVYFTQYSFPSAVQTVTVDIIANCRNMRWDGHVPSASGAATNNPTFMSSAFANQLNIYGSLTLISAMNWNFNAYTYFRATSTGQTITCATQEFDRDIYFEGIGGEWILQDDIRVNTNSGIVHNRGIFRTNNFNVISGSFTSNSGQIRELYMGSSVFDLSQIAQGFRIVGTNLTLNAGTSTINLNNWWINLQFSSPTASANRLYDVNFTDPTATTNAYFSTSGGTVFFHNVKFLGWGTITGNNVYNKLTFSPGKTYTLGSSQTQTVDTLDARGNNCFKIIIRSTTVGTQSTVSKATGSVVCDFLDLRDQRATGGATFFAGQFSNNTGNNTGWIFSNAPGYIFGLGPDTAFQTCGASITLTTLNFNATVSTSYVWNTGSTSGSLVVSTPGTYWVTANYGAGCLYTDSIRVTINPAIMNLQASSNTSVCQGGIYSMTASGGVTYSWGPSAGLSSTTGSNVVATPPSTTNYTVTAVNGLCTDSKVITVTVTPSPPLNATAAASVCQGVSAVLTASGASSYSWSPAVGLSATTGGSVTANPTTNTNYIVQGNNGGCISTATVVVTVGNTPIINIASQTNITCNGLSNGTANLTASGGAGGYYFTWSTAQTGNNITNLPVGTFTATVTDANGCTQTSAVTITQPAPLTLTVVSQTAALCNNSNTGAATMNASGGTAPYNYNWTAGHTGASVTNLAAALYTVTVNDGNNCATTNTVSISEPSAILLNMNSTNATCGASNGTASVNAAGGVNGFTYQWMPGGATTTVVTSLGAGIYTVTVTDANGCTSVNTSTVVSAGSPTLAIASQTNVSCNGLANGSATINVGGGNGVYNYSWSNSTTTLNLANAAQGPYTLTVTDGNGCSAILSINITEPSPLVANVTSQSNPTCNGFSNGAANIFAAGGTGAYNYVWSTAQTGNNITNLSAGTFTATVTDANNCTATTTVLLTEPAVLSLSVLSQSDVLCNGGSNGMATMNATGGTSPYNYLWVGGQTTAAITNLQATVYTVTVTDANNCATTNTVSISEPSAITLTLDSIDATCGLPNGAVSAAAVGGTGAFIYLWMPGNHSSSSFSSLSSGIYTATVTDANGCTTNKSITINSIASPTISVIAQNSVTCNGGSNGSVIVNASGGLGAYTYLWSNTSTTASLNNLSQGVYSATVTDANGCTSMINTTITEPTPLVINIASQNNVLCNGGNTGSASVNASGSNGGYNYLWSNSTTSASINNLTASVYTVTVTDANNCVSTETITITEPSALTSTVTSQTNVLCNGMATGAASVSGNGGSGGFIYTWSTGSNTSSINNVNASVYTVTITDANNCVVTETVTITQPSPITVSVSPSANICRGDNVSLTASASGGNASYTFLWEPGAFNGTPYTITPTATSTYTMIVTDGNGCTSGPHQVTLTVPSPLLLNVLNPLAICAGENANLTALAKGGAGGYNYQWNPGAVNNSNLSATPSITTTYSLLVTDNCSDSAYATVPVTVNDLPVVSFTSDVNQGCGPLCVNFNNTTPNTNFANWIFGDGTSSINAAPQNCYNTDGTYNVKLIITDANGCKDSATINNMITVYPNPTSLFTVSTNEATIVNPTIEFIDASSGATAWTWNFGDAATSSLQNPYYTYNDSGNYLVKQIVTNEYGCVDSSEQYIRIKADYVFYIPNTFTPNGDGLNEEFMPKFTGLDISRDYEFTIYDRWGNLIFKTNNPLIGWNARKNNSGETVIQDTYVWKITTRDILGKSHAYDGHVNVIR